MLKQPKMTDFFRTKETKNLSESVEIFEISDDENELDAEISSKRLSPIKKRKLANESETSFDSGFEEFEDSSGHDGNAAMPYFEQILELRNDENAKILFNDNEHQSLNKFEQLDLKSKLICFKLFTHIDKWYKSGDFLSKINVTFSTKKDETIWLDYLRINGFLDSNMQPGNELTVDEYIELLSVNDLKTICKSYKLTTKAINKTGLKELLLQTSKTQQTLCFLQKTSNELLRDKLKKLCGPLIKLSENFRNLLNRIYFLYKLSNFRDLKTVHDVHFFMFKIKKRSLILPSFQVSNNPFFSSRDQFISFERVSSFLCDIIDECDAKNYDKVLQIAIKTFEEFNTILKQSTINFDEERRNFFSVNKKYVTILTIACKALWNRYPELTHKFLELLLQLKNDFCIKAGKWFLLKALIEERFFHKPIQAVDVMMEAFQNEKISLIDRYELKHRALLLLNKKSIKIPSQLRLSLIEMLSKFNEDFVDDDNLFPVHIIRATSVHGTLPGQKRKYVSKNEAGDKSYNSVEKVVIDFYKSKIEYKNKNVKGIHTEEILLTTLFNLFFWDIIYDDDKDIRNVFINSNQYLPLDFYSETFYLHRQTKIDQRLADIAENWQFDNLLEFLSKNWHEHSEKRSIISSLKKFDIDILLEIVQCIDRSILSLIFKRLASNFKCFNSGLPDLFVWFPNEKKVFFLLLLFVWNLFN